MSGGHFNYENDHLAYETYGYEVNVNYGLENLQEDSARAANLNPLEDREISELVYDVFCLLHSFDWYKECDTSYETYKKDVLFFKRKWFGQELEARIDKLTERAIRRIEDVAYQEVGGLKEIIKEAKNESHG